MAWSLTLLPVLLAASLLEVMPAGALPRAFPGAEGHRRVESRIRG